MVAVVVSGAAGRLGSRIAFKVAEAEGLTLHAAVVRKGSSAEGQPVTGVADAALSGEFEAGLIEGGVLVETVANTRVALEHAELAAKSNMAVLMATTGFEAAERAQLEKLAEKVPVLLAPNLSAGIAVLTELVRHASAALADYDLEIVETHHRRKKDAPSGTAWALANAAAEVRDQDAERDAILARAGDTGPRGDQEIGMQSLRGGDVIGEHTVYLFGAEERIELTHRAQTRDVFAAGAVRAARFLGHAKRKPGMYSMRDALGLE